MATDAQAETAYRKLGPYLASVLGADILSSLDAGIADGEPYEALGWLLSSINRPGVSVTKDLFLQARDCLSDEDKEEYGHLLRSQHVVA
ncbi:hypothetical protein BACT_0178 [Bifidobacterium actinocoloniiforme DSM 22766]|uniref:Uncharacterized protein n=1 Tax=Bifidobacterium actinocoloniiforme DSM 22766 TaxID=1437605 RepID=A0A086YYJ6_9BIFI|nr:hypothetical protein [Bifidobacterium actinocoloniiforme]AKV55879.1 hypothetical protein AB656_06715 [Bifidobacterium actinocoloniiforme DSM 22766]KFI39346.1 hypothetical protein BACT_0178 [Bifidobacterium actinocoloniiforme DSM 22766]